MHYVVARLYRTQFFERQSELARAGAVTFKCVLVETVEYLMVREHAHPEPLVAEPFM